MGCNSSTAKAATGGEPVETTSVSMGLPALPQEQINEPDSVGTLSPSTLIDASTTWTKCGGEDLASLLEFTTLVDVRWLLKFARGEVMPECNGVIPAWQQLPRDAHVRLDQMRVSKMEWSLPIGVVSYGWAGRMHPDPSGEQLQALAPLLECIVRHCDESVGPNFSWGIVWDFMSLPQRGYSYTESIRRDSFATWGDRGKDNRTQDENDRFRKGLTHINEWYGAPFTNVLVLETPLPVNAHNTAPITQRASAAPRVLLPPTDAW